MNEKKMTKAVAWGIVRGIVEQSGHPQADELVAKIDNELSLLAKKNTTERKLTAAQVANEQIKADILATMTPGTQYTIGDLIKTVPSCGEFSTSKVSALIRQLKDEGKVVRTEDKRKAYFSLPV